MKHFHICFHSFQQARAFVELAMQQPFAVTVGNERQQINGKDLMGIFCLDHSKPVKVCAECSQQEFAVFQQAVAMLP
jgi:phosphotransferase system HPr-like phosphotransfer protein